MENAYTTNTFSGGEQINEFETWRDKQLKKKKKGAFGSIAKIDFSVRILTHGWWPSFVQVDVKLPDLFHTWQRGFEQYYYENTQNR